MLARFQIAIMSFMFRKSFTIIVIVICFLGYSCQQEDRETKIEAPLNSTWKFRKAESNTWYPARVPGFLSSDIASVNSHEVNAVFDITQIHKASWEYLTSFDVDNHMLAHDVVQLRFKGITSNADIYLNDSLLVKTSSRVSVKSENCKRFLKAKNNLLKIIFHHRNGQKNGHHHHFTETDSFPEEQCFHHGNELNNSIGIWRPIYLEAWSVAKIDDINLVPDSISSKKAIYTVQLTLTSVVNQEINLELLINNKIAGKALPVSLKKGSNTFSTSIHIDKPKLWWTNGLGNPNLYTITTRLKKGQTIIQEKHQKLGVRTIELVNRLNSPDHSCYIKLNGIPLFVKGGGLNLKSFLSDDSAKTVFRKILEDAKESNFNIVRVSNKDSYDNFFYDLCDTYGILLWQDLQVNSAYIYGSEATKEDMKQEMIETIKHIRKHPCLALWWIKEPEACQCKSNMSDSSILKKSSCSESNTGVQLLTSLVKEFSPSTQYLTDTETENKNMAGVDPFNGQLIGNMAVGFSVPSSEALKDKEKNTLKDFVLKNFGATKNPASEVYLRQLAQSEIIKSMIESHRIRMPRCMGSVYEKMIDDDRLSFSTIDSLGRWTPAQYAIKEAFSHILVAPVREKNEIKIYAVSDAFKSLDAFLLVRLIDFNGRDIFVRQIPVEIEANASSILMSLKENDLLKNTDRTKCCLVVQLNQATKTLSQNILYFTEFKNLKLPRPLYDMDINEVVKGYNIILKSPVLMKNVFIQTLTNECIFSDNNFDLLPGKRTKIHVSYGGARDKLLRDIRIRSFADTK